LPSTLYILLPAYNEERALRELIPNISTELKAKSFSYTILVMDDGSKDGTAALLQTLSKDHPLHILHHPVNRGYGAAIASGVAWAVQNARPEDVVITMDADNTHSPSYILPLIQKLDEGNGVVTASYTISGGHAYGVPWKRRVMSFGANFLLGMRFHLPGVSTYTNGFRAFRLKALQEAYRRHGDRLVELRHFAGGTELFVKVVQCGVRAGEIPFDLHYERRGTDTKIHIPRTIQGYLKLLRLPLK
jgi:dolichol-phosphate mannosyltransferase